MAHMVATHDNIRKPGMFSPYEGQVAEVTEANIKAAREGTTIQQLKYKSQGYN